MKTKKEKKKKTYSMAREIYRLLENKQKRGFLLILLILGITAFLSQLTPIIIGYLTDYVLEMEALHFISIVPFLTLILVVNVVNEVLKVYRRLIVEDTATQVEKLARQEATTSLLRAPLSYFREHMSGNIHGRLNRSLEGTVRLIKLIFMDFAPAIASGVAAIVVIFIQLPITIACIVILVIPFGVIVVFRQISTQKGIRVELMESKAEMDGTIVELLGGIETIRSLDSVDRESGRIAMQADSLRQKEMRHHRAMAVYDCIKFLNEAIFSVLVIAMSVYLAAKGTISVGSILTTYLCFTQLTGPLRELHRILDELSESVVLAKDYFAILHIEPDFSYTEGKDGSYMTQGNVAFQSVDFAYPEKPDELVMKGLTVEIENGRFVGVAGPSGCGKSSFIKILDKLEKAEGTIILGGTPIEELSRKELAEKIAYVPQTPFLVAGTIAHNICYGLEREVSVEEMKEAARKANLTEVIEDLPGTYDFLLSEGGKNLSGGQRQRIALARIFLKKPMILILDEATSALDNTSEKKIMAEIEQLHEREGVTIIAIAHRLSTLLNCDEILVMDHGNIVQRGTYEELKNTPGIFQNMERGILV